MAAIGTSNPTLLDQIKITDPDGSIAKVVEALQQRNPVLMDATAMEGNLPTGHRVTIRDGLPSVGWRMINQGITASKATTVQVDETCGLLEGRSEVDCELARLNGNEAAFRASQDRAFVQSMNHEAMSALFYASTKTDPEKIHGFTPRFDSKGGGNSDNIVDFDDITGDTADGDCFSIWFITWSPETCYLLYPKGMVGGLQSEDLGKDYVDEPATGSMTGRKYLAWRTHWIWRLGLCIADWRYIVRIANIDPSTSLVVTENFLVEAMIEAYNRVYDLNTGRTVIYMNRTALNWLDKIVNNKANVWLGLTEWHGKQITSFRGLPIVACDGLLTTESILSA